MITVRIPYMNSCMIYKYLPNCTVQTFLFFGNIFDGIAESVAGGLVALFRP